MPVPGARTHDCDEHDGVSNKPLDLVDPAAIEHLFDVAAELFAERGLDGVSVREISRASNVSIAAIYYHFKSKESLFAEVTLHRYEDFERELLKRIGNEPSGHADPVKVALAFFDMMIADDKLLRLLQRDMIAGSPDHRNFLSRHPFRHFRHLIDQMLGFDRQGALGAMKSFSFAAVLNGYSELVMADMDHVGEERAQYLRSHRDFLEQFVRQAFASMP